MGFIDDKSLYSGSMTFCSEVYVMKILKSVVFLLYSQESSDPTFIGQELDLDVFT